MSKYISASGMVEVVEMLRWSNYLDKNSTLNLLIRAIEQAPTDAIDAMEVVRCKDCKYWDKATIRKGFLICPASGMEIMDDDYCSYGKRKENT